jgi:hypothetical protein
MFAMFSRNTPETPLRNPSSSAAARVSSATAGATRARNWHAQSLLELPHRLADGRRRDFQRGRRGREAAALGDGREGQQPIQLGQFHY